MMSTSIRRTNVNLLVTMCFEQVSEGTSADDSEDWIEPAWQQRPPLRSWYDDPCPSSGIRSP
ncbi:hypothetical protein BC938DRAFT_475664 [Jimgerdemannia flammicorona]|uniref:Uncharacterized protein n=1 Tax=Jimgerdemannia flammicorona TaxID=994334 RepID=A0A433PQM2_9FUNG|nr:hypothetical protein BC938DRAFT_475664 [Jimgerdemannia flammicorona]